MRVPTVAFMETSCRQLNAGISGLVEGSLRSRDFGHFWFQGLSWGIRALRFSALQVRLDARLDNRLASLRLLGSSHARRILGLFERNVKRPMCLQAGTLHRAPMVSGVSPICSKTFWKSLQWIGSYTLSLHLHPCKNPTVAKRMKRTP